jgi:hypothetical protein
MANSKIIIGLITPMRIGGGEFDVIYCEPQPYSAQNNYINQILGVSSDDTIIIAPISSGLFSIKKSNIAWAIADTDPDDANMDNIFALYYNNNDIMGAYDLT